jgi:hypothetical protein
MPRAIPATPVWTDTLLEQKNSCANNNEESAGKRHRVDDPNPEGLG